MLKRSQLQLLYMTYIIIIIYAYHSTYTHMQTCSGHPNTPYLFGAICGLNAIQLPALVMSLHAVQGTAVTLSSWLQDNSSVSESDSAFLLLGM